MKLRTLVIGLVVAAVFSAGITKTIISRIDEKRNLGATIGYDNFMYGGEEDMGDGDMYGSGDDHLYDFVPGDDGTTESNGGDNLDPSGFLNSPDAGGSGNERGTGQTMNSCVLDNNDNTVWCGPDNCCDGGEGDNCCEPAPEPDDFECYSCSNNCTDPWYTTETICLGVGDHSSYTECLRVCTSTGGGGGGTGEGGDGTTGGGGNGGGEGGESGGGGTGQDMNSCIMDNNSDTEWCGRDNCCDGGPDDGCCDDLDGGGDGGGDGCSATIECWIASEVECSCSSETICRVFGASNCSGTYGSGVGFSNQSNCENAVDSFSNCPNDGGGTHGSGEDPPPLPSVECYSCEDCTRAEIATEEACTSAGDYTSIAACEIGCVSGGGEGGTTGGGGDGDGGSGDPPVLPDPCEICTSTDTLVNCQAHGVCPGGSDDGGTGDDDTGGEDTGGDQDRSGYRGGQTGGSGNTPRTVIPEAQMERGVTGSLGEGQSIGFESDGESHTMEVTDVNEEGGYMILEFWSEKPKYMKLGLGETQEMDLDEDGSSDVIVRLNSIEDGKPNVTLKIIEEPVHSSAPSVTEAVKMFFSKIFAFLRK